MRPFQADDVAGVESKAEMKFRFLILAHDVESNALGRALSMALVAAELGEVRVVGVGGSAIWPGSAQFPFDVAVLRDGWRERLGELLSSSDDNTLDVIWVCKGLSPLDSVVKHVRKTYPAVHLILDLDDDDSGLASQFMFSSPGNFLRIVLRPRMWPIRMKISQREISKRVDGFTFSSWVLAARFGQRNSPSVRVPHVRIDSVRAESTDRRLVAHTGGAGGLRYGVLGTLRPHKGGEFILSCLRANRSQVLVTFEDCGLGRPGKSDTNWIEIPKSTPLEAAYDLIDVAVIAMRGGGEATNLQLPAKLVDAMRAGVPVLATQTAAIEEYASGSIVCLPVDVTTERFSELLIEAANSDCGRLGHDVYQEVLTPAAASNELRSLLAGVTLG